MHREKSEGNSFSLPSVYFSVPSVPLWLAAFQSKIFLSPASPGFAILASTTRRALMPLPPVERRPRGGDRSPRFRMWGWPEDLYRVRMPVAQHAGHRALIEEFSP